MARLFYLQVLDKTYETATNSIRTVIEVPFRGLIYDRKGKQIVYNTPVYDLYVVPNKTKVGKLSKAQLEKIAKEKMPDLSASTLEAAMKTVAGTAKSMGVDVEV